MAKTITRDQVLDELQYLASVELALVVDHLQISYALGSDEGLGPDGAASGAGTDAAGAAMSAAIADMRHFGAVSGVLGRAGRRPLVARADHVLPASGPAIPVGSVTPARFQGFAARQKAIATTVDARYRQLEAAVGAAGAALDPELSGEIGFALAGAAGHADDVPTLVGPLAAVQPSTYLRATRVEPANGLERDLMAVSDRSFQALLAILAARFAHEDLQGDLFGRGQNAMTELDACNKLLVARGIIPRLSP